MEDCKAICIDCRYYSHSFGGARLCYYGSETIIDCVTGECNTLHTRKCYDTNWNGQCEDFEHRPKKPVKRWYEFGFHYEWRAKIQNWIMVDNDCSYIW